MLELKVLKRVNPIKMFFMINRNKRIQNELFKKAEKLEFAKALGFRGFIITLSVSFFYDFSTNIFQQYLNLRVCFLS